MALGRRRSSSLQLRVWVVLTALILLVSRTAAGAEDVADVDDVAGMDDTEQPASDRAPTDADLENFFGDDGRLPGEHEDSALFEDGSIPGEDPVSENVAVAEKPVLEDQAAIEDLRDEDEDDEGSQIDDNSRADALGFHASGVQASSSDKKNSEGESRVLAVDGCPKSGELQESKNVSISQKAATRCCSMDGSTCVSTAAGCFMGPFKEAEQVCAKEGMRLCSREELEGNTCCGSGCQFDHELVWTGKAAEPRVLAVDGCPKTGELQESKNVSISQKAATRCCSMDGSTCVSTAAGCFTGPFKEAEQVCAKEGMRLCSREELEGNTCCGSGCQFDHELVWTGKAAEPRVLAVDGCPKTGELQESKNVSISQKAATRCCSMDGSTCV
eukprot:CAMPEP_0203978492 /NCGR_PEP_ID=MMETSP0359-20131031/102144_1 /ASSEMBLY_ACC=CAM_ASM_000338 /TAXON_ID=268821 /ORGANISM="Scrippsiella Hangoei, Strain SHTV-5" /LENGTH=385 /DNA_ID=CAMNT_0050916703 /DNA_START=87 /DNA_END=1241 /DNA_ORIENTATION=+